MIVLYVLSYFNRNKQNSYAALRTQRRYYNLRNLDVSNRSQMVLTNQLF